MRTPILQAISEDFARNKADVLAGHYDGFLGKIFNAFSVLEQEGGKKVITFFYSEEFKRVATKELPFVDIFILPPTATLGDHYHENATAEIVVLQGSGIAKVGAEEKKFSKGQKIIFANMALHNVTADDRETVVFVSLQDHPIIDDQGRVDFHLPPKR